MSRGKEILRYANEVNEMKDIKSDHYWCLVVNLKSKHTDRERFRSTTFWMSVELEVQLLFWSMFWLPGMKT